MHVLACKGSVGPASGQGIAAVAGDGRTLLDRITHRHQSCCLQRSLLGPQTLRGISGCQQQSICMTFQTSARRHLLKSGGPNVSQPNSPVLWGELPPPPPAASGMPKMSTPGPPLPPNAVLLQFGGGAGPPAPPPPPPTRCPSKHSSSNACLAWHKTCMSTDQRRKPRWLHHSQQSQCSPAQQLRCHRPPRYRLHHKLRVGQERLHSSRSEKAQHMVDDQESTKAPLRYNQTAWSKLTGDSAAAAAKGGQRAERSLLSSTAGGRSVGATLGRSTSATRTHGQREHLQR
jgi:hypothetical protein